MREQSAVAVRDLRIETTAGVEIVDELSFELSVGKILALVGESGCGKTSVGMALLGHARPGTRIAGGSITVGGRDLLTLSTSELRQVRGREVSYVPQDPSASLSPRCKIGTQLVEASTNHGGTKAAAVRRARELLGQVRLPASDDFMRRYPFELSGGQQQRVLIAMALACGPRLVVLDEPTTGLDVTTQARILEMIGQLATERSLAVLYITHDLAVVSELADRVAIMYSGRIVEMGQRSSVFHSGRHPYSQLLLSSVPAVSARHELRGIPGKAASPGERPGGCFFRPRCPVAEVDCETGFPPATPAHGDGYVRCFRAGQLKLEARGLPDLEPAAGAVAPLLEVRQLELSYGTRSSRVVAVNGVSFSVAPGECVALVGESGSGKTSTGRCIAGLTVPDSGSICLRGKELPSSARKRSREELRAIQIIFQNPDTSLNPSHTVRRLIERPLTLFSGKRGDHTPAVERLMDRVRLSARLLDRYPFELSGGEKQRVAIARALAAEPDLVICDEITSALDVSIQAAILDMLDELRHERGVTMFFITHNLGVVRALADRTLVMAEGRIREEGITRVVIDDPHDSYTKELIAAAPRIRRDRPPAASQGVEP